MPFVLDGERGEVEIAAQGERHRIDFGVDRIRQEPVVEHEVEPDDCKNRDRGPGPLARFSLLNPDGREGAVFTNRRRLHLAEPAPDARRSTGSATRRIDVAATDRRGRSGSRPIRPRRTGTIAERFERLIAAYVAHDADSGRTRTVREFVAEFRGLSGSAKQKAVLDAAGLSRAPLSRLVVDGRIDPDGEPASCSRRCRRTPSRCKPALLGVIGREHFEARFAAAGCEMESFDYRKVADYDDDGIPFVIETAFGWRGDKAEDERAAGHRRQLVARHPQSVPRARRLRHEPRHHPVASSGSIADEPVIFVLHVACPRVEYTDRGKSAVVVRS